MGLFSWLFGRNKKKKKMEQYVHFRPGVSKTSGRGEAGLGIRGSGGFHDDTHWSPKKSIMENRDPQRNIPPSKEVKKRNPDYWDSQDFPQDSYYDSNQNSQHHDNHQHQAPSSPSHSFHGFSGGQFGGGGASDSWDQHNHSQHSGSHGSESSHSSSSHDTQGSSSGDDSFSSDSGGGDSGDSSGGGD